MKGDKSKIKEILVCDGTRCIYKEYTEGGIDVADINAGLIKQDGEDGYTEYYNSLCSRGSSVEIGTLVIGGRPSALTTFATDPWSTIKTNIDSGLTYRVGDTKCVELKDIETTNDYTDEGCKTGDHLVRLVNTSTCTGSQVGEGKSETACGFVIAFVDNISEHVMNTEGTNAGGWKDSEMRTYVNDTIYESLPTDLKSIIIDTKVISILGETRSEDVVSNDKLYLLSPEEVYAADDYDDSAKGSSRMLDYYIPFEYIFIYTSIPKYINGTNRSWWFRSQETTIAENFFDNSGSAPSHNTFGVSPAFRIGE